MIKRLFSNVVAVGGYWLAFLSFGAYLFTFSYPHLRELSKGMDLPEEMAGSSWHYQSLFLDTIGDNGVAVYSNFQLMDMVNGVLLGLVLTSTIYLILYRLKAAKLIYVLCLLPLVMSALDVAENAVMLKNLGNLPDLDKGLSEIFMRLTQAKLLLLLISVFILVTCVVTYVVRMFGKRDDK
jgi:hypothetical protein